MKIFAISFKEIWRTSGLPSSNRGISSFTIGVWLKFFTFSPPNSSLPYSAAPDDVSIAFEASLLPPPDRARKLSRRRFGSASRRRPSISWWVRSQIGTALANNVMPFGVRAISRLRRSPGSAATITNPRRSNGFNAAVNVVRSIVSKDATAAIAGGSGRFSDISNENCPFVRSSDRSASSKRRARARAARCT
jgi:hypothetical protein